MSWILAAAQGGLSILQGFQQSRAAGRAMAAQVGAATLQGGMERLQLELSARDDARLRSEELRSVLASQQAAFGQRGVMGGRSARLMRTMSQTAAMREQDVADRTTQLQVAGSRVRQQSQVAAARTAGQAGVQSGMTRAIGGAAQMGMDLRRYREQSQAGA